jgi:soluble lytic murein transglycosylase-like protein
MMLKQTVTIGFLVIAWTVAPAQAFLEQQEYPAIFETGAPTEKKLRPVAKRMQKSSRHSRTAQAPSPELAALISHHATANGVPAELAHRVIMRESRYNAAARNRAYWGLMQISHATARGVGYRGPAQGLLNPDTNLRYGMAYLGNAYRVAGGDQSRALRLYASGFYYEAKRKGMLGQIRPGEASRLATR